MHLITDVCSFINQVTSQHFSNQVIIPPPALTTCQDAGLGGDVPLWPPRPHCSSLETLPYPRVKCLSQPMVQIYPSHFLPLCNDWNGHCPFSRASKPTCPWSRRKSKARYPIQISGSNQEQRAALTSESRNTTFFTWQPLLLWGEPAPPLFSVHSSALCHSLGEQTTVSLYQVIAIF